MPRFNEDRITKLVSEMRKSVGRLKTLKTVDKNSFLNDPDKIGSAKYHLIVGIESAIDICNHIISQNGYRTPDDYADAFRVIAEKGAFDDSFVQSLRDMAKFRNRLVHIYWEVDDGQVYEILQTRLDDFKTFLDRIALFLQLEKF